MPYLPASVHCGFLIPGSQVTFRVTTACQIVLSKPESPSNTIISSLTNLTLQLTSLLSLSDLILRRLRLSWMSLRFNTTLGHRFRTPEPDHNDKHRSQARSSISSIANKITSCCSVVLATYPPSANPRKINCIGMRAGFTRDLQYPPTIHQTSQPTHSTL